MSKTWNIVALVLIVLGFGILHNKYRVLEIAGSVCIGIGSLYFLVVLIRANRNADNE